jgi:hypothetical protein
MADISEKMREGFEAWTIDPAAIADSAQILERAGDGYRLSTVDTAWTSWQASRAAMVIELPPSPEVPEDPEEAIDDSHMDGFNAANRMRAACAKSITAAGLKVSQ